MIRCMEPKLCCMLYVSYYKIKGFGFGKPRYLLYQDDSAIRASKCGSHWNTYTKSITDVRVDWCKQIVKKHNGGASKNVCNIVASTESWICMFVRVLQDKSNPTKFVRACSTLKQMAACLNCRQIFI